MVDVAGKSRVNHGRTTSGNGQATEVSDIRRCYTLQTTEADGKPSPCALHEASAMVP